MMKMSLGLKSLSMFHYICKNIYKTWYIFISRPNLNQQILFDGAEWSKKPVWDLRLWVQIPSHPSNFSTLDCKTINKALSIRLICSVRVYAYGGSLIKVFIDLALTFLSLYCNRIVYPERRMLDVPPRVHPSATSFSSHTSEARGLKIGIHNSYMIGSKVTNQILYI